MCKILYYHSRYQPTYLSFSWFESHMARTKLFHLSRFLAIFSASFHVQLILFRSSSFAHLFVSLWCPRSLFPSGVHLNAVFVIFPGSFLRTCPIHLQLLLNISACIVVSDVLWCISLLVIFLGQYILQIPLRQLLWKAESLFKSSLVICHVSALYNRTDLTIPL